MTAVAPASAWFTKLASHRGTAQRKLVQVAPPVQINTPSASNDRAVSESFRTRQLPSRRALAAGWMAGLASAAQVASVPISAWTAPARVARRVSQHRFLRVAPLHWPYIAPTMAAIIPAPQSNVVTFRRRIQIPIPLVTYPQALSTAPPTAWYAAQRKRVSHDKRLLTLTAQPGYPATSTPSNDRASVAWFVTNTIQSRRALSQGWIAALIPQAAVPSVVYAAIFGARVKRQYKKRRRYEHGADTYESVTPITPVSAFTRVPALRRESMRRRTWLLTTPEYPVAAVPTTSAVYPSFVPATQLESRHITRLLAVALDAPVYPVTPVAPVVVTAWSAAGVHRRKSRVRRRAVSSVPDYEIAVVPTYPAVYPSFVLQFTFNRRSTKRSMIRVAAVTINRRYRIDGSDELVMTVPYSTCTVYSDGAGHYFTIN